MKKTIGMMILLGASVAAAITPAVAEERDHRGVEAPYVNQNYTRNGFTAYRHDDDRRTPEIRRDEHDRDREAWLRNERFRRERDNSRERFDRDSRRW